VREEIKDKKLVAKMVEAAHATAAAIDTSPASLINALRAVEQKISKLVDMAADTGNRSLVAKLEELEAERDRLQQERATLAEREKLKQGLRNLRTRDVEAMLEFAAKLLDGQEIGQDPGRAGAPRGARPRRTYYPRGVPRRAKWGKVGVPTGL
jgi:hypothetical protein